MTYEWRRRRRRREIKFWRMRREIKLWRRRENKISKEEIEVVMKN